MNRLQHRSFHASALLGLACALALAGRARATGVPIGGFLPMVGIALTDEFRDDLDTFAYPSSEPGGTPLGRTGAHYDVALLDTGAALSLLTAQAHYDFKMDGPYPGEPDGFAGTEQIEIGGATGNFFADIDDPVGLYAGGLQGSGTNPLVIDHNTLEGQTNTSLATLPAESDLPNIVGLTFSSRYATHIRNDLPQIFQLDGRTVRAPQIEFLELGSGGQGIARRAPMSLNPGSSFTQPPIWFYNIENFDIDNPHENPSIPTAMQGGMFLTANVTHGGNGFSNSQFLFDTGADVTVLSEQRAYSQLLLDPENPDFTVAVIGSGGIKLDVPGYFLEQFTIQAVMGGGNLTLSNVPVVVLDVTNPADPPNIVDGIIGTNLLSGRNLVIDPKTTTVGPSLYISDPVTTQKNWATAAASGLFGAGGNWTGGTAPDIVNRGIANVRHVAGGNQTAVVAADATVWELNVSGTANESMTVDVQSGVTLTTFSGINIEQGGAVNLHNATLDAQFVEILGGALRGGGLVTTGSGPIPGQVENRSGTIAPGSSIGVLNIEGRFANGSNGTLDFELGGLAPATQYDQIVVDGGVTLDGTLAVSLIDLGGGLFAPSVGDAFQLITATDGIGGTFQELLLPDGVNWMVNYTSTSVELLVGLPGDYNHDGTVDAADYVVWRTTSGSPANYAAWRDNFGATMPGGGAAGAAAAPVPEPAAAVLFALAAWLLAHAGRVTPAAPCAASTMI
jgi:hypothetical protein